MTKDAPSHTVSAAEAAVNKTHFRNNTAKHASVDADAVSHVSNLTADDASTVVSFSDRVTSSIGSVLGQAKRILEGEAPILEDETDGDEVAESPSNLVVTLEQEIGKSRSARSLGEDNNKGESVSTARMRVAKDFLRDERSEMTFSRRIALALSHKSWYNPRAKEEPEFAPNEIETPEASTRIDSQHSMPVLPVGGPNIEAYPFTHSRRENPSLGKAWACTYGTPFGHPMTMPETP